jgi:hypothetical protein
VAENDDRLRDQRVRRIAGIYRIGNPFMLCLLTVGVYGSAFSWRPGAFLMLTAVSGYVVLHLGAGFAAYRDAMTRPWPKVPPVDDDDDW